MSGAIWGGSWKVWGGFSEGFERSEGILGAFEGLWAAWGGSWKVWEGFWEGFETSESILDAFEGLWAAFCH